MKLLHRPLLIALPALFAAGTALADVSATDVWESYKAQLEMGGQAVTTVSEEQSGDTLTISGIEMTGPESDVTLTITMPDIAFREVGDGTVEILLDPEYPMDLSVTAPEGTFAATVMMTTTDMVMTASGEPGDIKFDYSADELAVSVDSVIADGEALPLNVLFVLKDSSGTWTVDTTAGVDFVADLIAGAMDITIEASNPENADETFKATGSIADIKLTESGVFPDGIDLENLSAALAAGFELIVSMSSGLASYSFEFNGSESASGTFNIQTSILEFAIAEAGLSYLAGATGIDLSLIGDSMPPVTGTLDEYAVGVTLPVAKTDAAQDIALLFKLVGLTLNEEIWSQFDPGQVLPRDPATLVIDVSGKGFWTADVFDPSVIAMLDMFPAEMETLDLNEVRLDAAGLDVTAKGSLTFDNGMTEMGMPPMPLGKIDLFAIGVNGFLDNLVSMGVLTAEDLFPAKLMIGMYAKPGSEPDSLETTVELTPDGGLLVNGMPLQ